MVGATDDVSPQTSNGDPGESIGTHHEDESAVRGPQPRESTGGRRGPLGERLRGGRRGEDRGFADGLEDTAVAGGEEGRN